MAALSQDTKTITKSSTYTVHDLLCGILHFIPLMVQGADETTRPLERKQIREELPINLNKR